MRGDDVEKEKKKKIIFFIHFTIIEEKKICYILSYVVLKCIGKFCKFSKGSSCAIYLRNQLIWTKEKKTYNRGWASSYMLLLCTNVHY